MAKNQASKATTTKAADQSHASENAVEGNIAAETVTAEGAEPGNPAGVVSVDSPAFPGTDDTRTIAEVDAQIKAANAYTVAWHVKAGGKRYAPGDEFPAELLADELLASGAVVKA